MKKLVAFLSCTLLALLLSAPSHAQQGTVTGQVTTQPTGEPVDGVLVTVQDTDLRTTTSGDGQFRIGGVPAGTRVVQARLDGYKARGRAVSVPIGGTAEVRLELQPKSSSPPERGTSSSTDGTGSETASGQSSSCSAVTVPESWVATEAGREGSSQRLRGQTYRVRQYMVPNLLEGVKTTEAEGGLVPIPTRASGPSRLQDDTPIQSEAELVSVLAHHMNTDAASWLSVRQPNEWSDRAERWEEQRRNIYDPQTGKVATGLLLGGKLLASVGVSMSTGDLTTISKTGATAAGFALELGSTSLSFYQSVTATPKDESLAPAMAALADLDPEYRKKILEIEGGREYLNRYFEASSEVADVASSLEFAASEWDKVATSIQNYRAAQNPVLVNTPAGTQALSNAHDFMNAALVSAGLTVAQEIVFRNVEDLTSGFNALIYTANLYTTVLEAYARRLDSELEKLKSPSSFDSWKAYSEALAQYQYRVGRYHEVKLGLATNLYEYASRLNSKSAFGTGIIPGISSASVPDESVETFRRVKKRQRKTYSGIIREITRQMHVIDLAEARYPNFAEKNCSSGEEAVSEESFRDEMQPGSITLVTRGQKAIGRSEKEVEWRYSTERPEPLVSERKNGVAYVVDGKGYRAEASHVYALEVTTGDLLWEKEIGGYTQARVLRVRGGTLIVEHSSGMYALDAETGGTLWVYDDFDDETTSFTFAQGTLLFLDGMPSSAHEMMGSRSPSTLHAVNLETGQGRWSKAVVPERHPRPTSHAHYSVEGEVVVAKNTRTGRTYRLDLETGEKVASGDPGSNANKFPDFISGKVVNVNEIPFQEKDLPYEHENIISREVIKLELKTGDNKRIGIELPGRKIDLIFEPYGDSDRFWTIMKVDVEGYSTFRLYGRAPHGPGANQLAMRDEGKVYDYSELIEPNVLLLLKPVEFYGERSDLKGGVFKIFVATHK